MFMHDPTLYGATFPYREFPIQNPGFAPWQNFSMTMPIQNPYLGFERAIPPQFPDMQQFAHTPQVPFFPYGYNQTQFPAVNPYLQNVQFPVNPLFPQSYAWNTPWSIPFGYQPRLPF